MKHRMGFTILSLAAAACFAVAPSVYAQGMGSSQQSQQTQQQPRPSLKNPSPQTPAPPAVDPKEEAAYKAFYAIKPAEPADVDALIQAGEAFVKNYPQSRYRAVVYSRLTNAYFQKRELDKMYAAGDKTLQLNPNDVSVLALVGWVIPRGDPRAPNFAAQLTKAKQYDERALQILATLPKPADLTDAQFAAGKAAATSQAHSGLGLIYFRQGNDAQSAAELEKATQGITNPDPTDFFVLGVDQEGLHKYADAEKSFDSCAQMPSSLQDRCKQSAADAKEKAATQLQPPKP